MSDMSNALPRKIIEEALFKTEALRVAPHDKPFWYAAGTFGPFYCNTHFLFDGEESASEMLKTIDAALSDKDGRLMLQSAICGGIARRYAVGGAFTAAIDALTRFVKDEVDLDAVDAVSGGERRDWFFSLAVARKLDMGHIAVFKDMSANYLPPDALAACWDGSEAAPARDLRPWEAPTRGLRSEALPEPGRGLRTRGSRNEAAPTRVLHVSDLVTEASSYKRAWIPALRAFGIRVEQSVSIVDRLQGGGETLAGLGVRHYAAARLNEPLFDRALSAGLIDADQRARVAAYVGDRDEYIKAFLADNPNFVADTIASGGKDAERARLFSRRE